MHASSRVMNLERRTAVRDAARRQSRRRYVSHRRAVAQLAAAPVLPHLSPRAKGRHVIAPTEKLVSSEEIWFGLGLSQLLAGMADVCRLLRAVRPGCDFSSRGSPPRQIHRV